MALAVDFVEDDAGGHRGVERADPVGDHGNLDQRVAALLHHAAQALAFVRLVLVLVLPVVLEQAGIVRR